MVLVVQEPIEATPAKWSKTWLWEGRGCWGAPFDHQKGFSLSLSTPLSEVSDTKAGTAEQDLSQPFLLPGTVE